MNERGRERTAAGLGTVGRRWAGGRGKGRAEGACLLTLAHVLKERWGRRGGGGGRGGLSPYINSCLIRVLAAKHLPCSPTPIHITPVLLHP